MFVLGLLAVLQITVLPGALILRAVQLRGSFIQRLIFTFALSLICNYCLAFVLAAAGLYQRGSLLVIFAAELVALAWLYRDEFSKPAGPALQQAADVLLDTIHRLFPRRDETARGQGIFQLFDTLLLLASLGLAIGSLLWVFTLFIRNLGTVFNAWDAVVSWNRWAMAWASGHIPLDSGLYPQLVPANWSVTYVFMDEPTIQFFAKGIMPLFAFFILLAMFDLGLNRDALASFTGVVITRLLIKKFLEVQITEGYMDLAVAFFAFLPVYALLKARDLQEHDDLRQKTIMFGALFAAGAAVAKQAGMYMFLLYPVLVAISELHPPSGRPDWQTWKRPLIVFALAALIPLSWYGLKGAAFMLGYDSPETGRLIEVSSLEYDQAGIGTQIVSSFARFEEYLLLFVAVAAGLLLLSPLYRGLILLVVIPYPFIWAWLAGYDTRNLSVFIPIFGITSGMALQEIYRAAVQWAEKSGVGGLKNYTWPALLVLALVAGHFMLPTARLVDEQTRLQKLIFSPSKNQKIYELIEKEGEDTTILTNYPVAFLPGLGDNQIHFTFKNYSTFLEFIEDPEIEYLLVSNNIDDQVKAHIDAKIASGEFVLIFVDKEWITYRMIRIAAR